ncbi:hypothetical protein PUN28_002706 [Cardiocondyla obscurior]|uniref:Uncharacterized protein n=1 Tax=Cardiocondyla obscurior TaxID=286306 RepID=A0AAW2GVV9_9HYME
MQEDGRAEAYARKKRREKTREKERERDTRRTKSPLDLKTAARVNVAARTLQLQPRQNRATRRETEATKDHTRFLCPLRNISVFVDIQRF